jgi:hypothetical protein
MQQPPNSIPATSQATAPPVGVCGASRHRARRRRATETPTSSSPPAISAGNRTPLPPPPCPVAAEITADTEPELEGENSTLGSVCSAGNPDCDWGCDRRTPLDACLRGAVALSTLSSSLPAAPRWFNCLVWPALRECAGGPPLPGGAEPVALGTSSRYSVTAGFPGGARYVGRPPTAVAAAGASAITASASTSHRSTAARQNRFTRPYTARSHGG